MPASIIPAIAPLRQIAPASWLLELFHGPTLAFKDLAMQVVARLMDRALRRKGARATIVGATSGDTGAAAIEAFRGLDMIDIFILHPKGRVTEVQRRQMTSAHEPNVHNIAVEGTFDDCQGIVKALFNDAALRDASRSPASTRSTSPASLRRSSITSPPPWPSAAPTAPSPSPCRPEISVIFSRVTPREPWACRSNASLLPRTSTTVFPALSSTGIYEPRGVIATSSPSMDIQLASNFERLLFELAGRDGARVRARMDELRRTGAFHLEQGELAELRALFAAHSIDEHETEMTIAIFMRRPAW